MAVENGKAGGRRFLISPALPLHRFGGKTTAMSAPKADLLRAVELALAGLCQAEAGETAATAPRPGTDLSSKSFGSGPAKAGDRDAAHELVQQYENDATAAWIHAVLHKIEGDLANSRYWYRRADRMDRVDDEPRAELAAIQAELRTRSGT